MERTSLPAVVEPLKYTTMLSSLNYLLVTTTCLISVCAAIRVEWNTNTGPIIPPTPRTTVRPIPPFREPAPVWEDLSNDISNPNPYIYVPPPPSRPKQRLNTNVNYNSNAGSKINYGTLLTPQNANNHYQHSNNNNNNNSPRVASLSPQYIPNVGKIYVAVVPTSSVSGKPPALPNKFPQDATANALSPVDYNSYKLQGKYNAKTKKYKAYEKLKYVPLNYNFQFKRSDNSTIDRSALLSENEMYSLNLPAEDIEKQWTSPFDTISSTATPLKTFLPLKSYTKHVYAKAKTAMKSKAKFNDSVLKVKKS